jgi:hypothetical protein
MNFHSHQESVLSELPDSASQVGRYPWLSLGVIPVGLYDLVRPIPAVDKKVARLGTLIVANSCAQRADRVALLMLLGEEVPGFIRGNPPSFTSPATILPLAPSGINSFYPVNRSSPTGTSRGW